ncbi:MAG: TonB-dependent receptor plug domain-containing protein [Microscillaceae bacterium]|jgi:iron complex outermembrane receptor protein|nr:TonB-dependent receptor plug domain-containing protein [Microscillaceae bacterium]
MSFLLIHFSCLGRVPSRLLKSILHIVLGAKSPLSAEPKPRAGAGASRFAYAPRLAPAPARGLRHTASIGCASSIWVILFNLLIINYLSAQTDTVQIKLHEVEIYGMPDPKYLAGAKIEAIDSLSLRTAAHQNIGDLLLGQTGIYFKQYGNGMLASAAFRGTGASHTAVLWNGLNINALTYGQTDFSLLPAFANENIDIQYGAASALYGSDALGGTIHLSSQPNWNKGLSLDYQQFIGSFGLFSSNAGLSFSKRKFESKTRLYYTELANNFPFQNLTISGKPTERQNNAAYKLYGGLQELNYRFAQNRHFSLKAWYSHRDLAIQPTMSGNQDFQNFTSQRDESLRLMADYYDNSAIGFFNVKIAYLLDNLVYNHYSQSLTHRWIGQVRYEKKLTETLSLQAGINSQQVVAQVADYGQNRQENRTDFFVFLGYKPLKNWQLSLNIRQALVTGFAAPLAPSLGSNWQFFKKEKASLSLKNLLARSYRVPTLNDRFWNPGGNPNLRSESGWSAEIGLVYQYQTAKIRWETELTHYQMWINDWILWQPQVNFWQPQNQRKVHAQGLEINQNLHFQSEKIQTKIGISYAYTRSTNQEDEQINFRDKQLPYTPLHRVAFNGQVIYRHWWLALNWHYTSLRYETLDNLEGLLTSIPAFDLFNFSAGKSFKIQKHQIHITLKINNLTNNQYQNYLFRAMPGINYQLGLGYRF